MQEKCVADSSRARAASSAPHDPLARTAPHRHRRAFFAPSLPRPPPAPSHSNPSASESTVAARSSRTATRSSSRHSSTPWRRPRTRGRRFAGRDGSGSAPSPSDSLCNPRELEPTPSPQQLLQQGMVVGPYRRRQLLFGGRHDPIPSAPLMPMPATSDCRVLPNTPASSRRNHRAMRGPSTGRPIIRGRRRAEARPMLGPP